MQNEVNRAIMAKKNQKYSKPIVEVTQLAATANLLTGSTTGLGIGDPINGGEGG